MTQNKTKAMFLVIRPTGTKEELVVNAFENYSQIPQAVKESKYLKVRMAQLTPIQLYVTMHRLGKIS